MASPFTHLLWKEYRAQRQLWLILAMSPGVVGLLMALLGTADPQLMAEIMVPFTTALALAFGAASSTLCFAQDEEEGTAIWTRMFPVQTSTLVLAKMTVVVVGTVLLCLLSGMLCSIAMVVDGGITAIAHLFRAEYWKDAGRMTAGGVSLIAMATFWSLLRRKVFSALTWCGITFVFYRAVCLQTEAGPLSAVGLGFTAAVIGAIVWAAPRWHRGLNASVLSLRPRKHAHKEHGRLHRLTSLYRHAWQGSLRWCATQTPVASRTTMTLLWLELRSAVPFIIWCAGIGIAAIISRYVRLAPWFPLVFLFAPLVIECGLRTFRHDQQRLHGLFWSHRGISPLLILTLRTTLWLGVFFLLAVPLITIEEGLFALSGDPILTSDSSPTTCQLLQDLARRPAVLQLVAPPSSGQLFYTGARIATAWAVAAFAISLLCSCWIRRPLVAGFVALISAVGMTIWLGYVVAADIPLWLTVLPMSMMCLLAVFFTRTQWMDRRVSRKIAFHRGTWVAIPCLCMIPVQREWRATEIPANLPFFNSTDYAAAGYAREFENDDFAQAWSDFDRSVAGTKYSGVYEQRKTEATLADSEQLGLALKALDRISDFDLTQHHLPPKLRTPWSPRQWHLPAIIWRVLRTASEESQKAGEIQQACDRVIQALRLLTYLSNEASGWPQWQHAHTHLRSTLEKLQQLAADDQLTKHELDVVQEKLLTAVTASPFECNVMANRMIAYYQILMREGYLWDRFENAGAGGQRNELSAWPRDFIRRNKAERIRVLKLMAAMESYADSRTFWLNRNDGRLAADFAALRKWVNSTCNGQDETDLPVDPTLEDNLRDISSADQFRLSTINCASATLTIIALQQHRRIHGDFPQQLSDLRDAESMVTESMPGWSHNEGLRFGYAPHGFGRPLPVFEADGNGHVIAATQPLIWSHHPHVSMADAASVMERDGYTALPADAGRVYYFDASHYSYQYTRHWPNILTTREAAISETPQTHATLNQVTWHESRGPLQEQSGRSGSD